MLAKWFPLKWWIRLAIVLPGFVAVGFVLDVVDHAVLPLDDVSGECRNRLAGQGPDAASKLLPAERPYSVSAATAAHIGIG
jgi:hypothetical protein